MNPNSTQTPKPPLVNAYDLGQHDATEYFRQRLTSSPNHTPAERARYIDEAQDKSPGYASAVMRLGADNAFYIAYVAGFDTALNGLIADLRESDTVPVIHLPPTPPLPQKRMLIASDETLRTWAVNDATSMALSLIAETGRSVWQMQRPTDLPVATRDDLVHYTRLGKLSTITAIKAENAMRAWEDRRGVATDIQRRIYVEKFIDQFDHIIMMWNP